MSTKTVVYAWRAELLPEHPGQPGSVAAGTLYGPLGYTTEQASRDARAWMRERGLRHNPDTFTIRPL